MQATKTRAAAARSGIIYLRTDEVQPNPVQPRTVFDEASLAELSESIRSYGILNPLTVRRRGGRYELVAGERRLRAARLAGLREVPCVLLDVNMEDAGLIALVENLQRKDLDFLEEANGIRQLIRMFGMSQEEAARRLGKSQSAVANKLRLFKLPEDVLETLRDRGLSERHGRALLRLPDDESRRAALEKFIERDMTVAAAEGYVDALLAQKAPPETGEGKKSFVMRDLRLFLNSVTRSLDLMRQGGVAADLRRQETDDALILTISIPKTGGREN
ncbi:MAG: ParB/RepB/Spo0J family partition protein [Oscillospiraceae bacterium]|nr:ParB/RepB/Spo0J family partition protein [Oscillospiraceae bacterium]